jgi:RimJ/RimL family protein N-acetyltransferase
MNPENLKIPTRFTSERLTYRPYVAGDSAFYFQMLQDNWTHLYEFMPIDLMPIKSKEDVEIVWQKHQEDWDARKLFIYGIWEKTSGNYVGETYLANPDWKVPRIEIGYFIIKSYLGNGLATEAAKAATNLAFTKFGMSRVEMQVVSDNLASRRVVEKSGFIKEGYLRQNHRKKDGTLVDTIWYGMLLSEWEK